MVSSIAHLRSAPLTRDLADSLARVSSGEEMLAVFADLCTPAEVQAMGERWHVARLLNEGKMTYREIHDATGVSTTTIVRVARFLRQEDFGGYRLLLAKAERAS